MKILTALYEKQFGNNEKELLDSDEFISQRNKYLKLYDELSATLNEEQKKKLYELDSAHFKLGDIIRNEGVEQSTENGFKLMMKYLIQSLI